MVSLGIADLIKDGKTGVLELASIVGADSDALSRVLRHLVGTGVLKETHPGHMELTNIGSLLVKGHPSHFDEIFQMDSVSRRFEASISELLHSVMTGEPSYQKANGGHFWDQLAADGVLARTFDIDMEEHIGSIGPDLARLCDWSTTTNVVDIGGGTGALLSHLLSEHHHLRGTLVEYANAATRAREILAKSDLNSRIAVYEGSFFEPLPGNADVYILSWILHDWPDSEAIAILKKCREAAGVGGRVFIIERPLEPENAPTSTNGDIRMMVFVGGRERSLDEYSDLLGAAGLQLENSFQLQRRFMLMIAREAVAAGT